jgi:hypothetical protein
MTGANQAFPQLLVVLNLFQDNKRQGRIMLKQVQHDEIL